MVTPSKELLEQINAAISAGKINAYALAREAGISPTSLYTMLQPAWKNRAVDNVDAVAQAFARMTKRKPPPARSAKVGTRAKAKAR